MTKAKTREQRLSKKFAESFISEDVQDVKSYVIFDVIIPTIKDTVMDLFSMAFYGNSYNSRRSSGRGYYTNERTSYSSYYKNDRERDRREERKYRRSTEVPEIILETRMEGQDVLEEMNNLIDEYDNVSVGDLCQIVGISGQYTDERFGWYDLSSAKIRRCRDGYLLDLPRPKPLD